MAFKIYIAALSALLLLPKPCWAQTAAPASQSNKDDFGIVVNETVTQGGQEFYRRFTDFWRERSDFESYTLVITERPAPSRRYGNRILVSYGQNVVFTANLPIKVDAIKALSNDAAEKAYANIFSLSLRMTGDRDPDISSDGM